MSRKRIKITILLRRDHPNEAQPETDSNPPTNREGQP